VDTAVGEGWMGSGVPVRPPSHAASTPAITTTNTTIHKENLRFIAPPFTLHVLRFTFYHVLRFTFYVSRFTFHVLRFTFHVSR